MHGTSPAMTWLVGNHVGWHQSIVTAAEAHGRNQGAGPRVDPRHARDHRSTPYGTVRAARESVLTISRSSSISRDRHGISHRRLRTHRRPRDRGTGRP